MNNAAKDSEKEKLPRRLDKRCFDLLIGGFFLIALSPILLFIFVCMIIEACFRKSSRGSFFYREIRISHGELFSMLKFRTIKQDILDRAQEEADFSGIKVLEQDNDNLTGIGRILRDTYMDELPQLFNIIRGDMSLVGPRPWPPELYEKQLSEGINTKGIVPCGLTGPVQAKKGYGEKDYVPLDMAYIDAYRTKSTLGMLLYDLGIIWQSIKIILERKGI